MTISRRYHAGCASASARGRAQSIAASRWHSIANASRSSTHRSRPIRSHCGPRGGKAVSNDLSNRGRAWFAGLTGVAKPMPGDPQSVLTADAKLGEERARFLCVVPNPRARFPCARGGEVGLEEAYTLGARVNEVIEQNTSGDKQPISARPIIAIVDVKSQAYGRREETAAIFLACATAAEAYASARMRGHPVITLVVG